MRKKVEVPKKEEKKVEAPKTEVKIAERKEANNKEGITFEFVKINAKLPEVDINPMLLETSSKAIKNSEANSGDIVSREFNTDNSEMPFENEE